MALGIQPVDLMNEASLALLIQTPSRHGQCKPKFEIYKLDHRYTRQSYSYTLQRIFDPTT